MVPNRATERATGMSKDKVEAVERALAVLNAFHADKPTMTLGEIASATGFYKSTILRLAGSLERLGYLIREERGVTEPQSLHHAGTKIFDHDVGGGDQPREGLAALR